MNVILIRKCPEISTFLVEWVLSCHGTLNLTATKLRTAVVALERFIMSLCNLARNDHRPNGDNLVRLLRGILIELYSLNKWY